LLGDRIRMMNKLDDSGLYVRSMATRGALGGLSGTTEDAALVIEASGCDVILIETVGVGQDEVEIARLADITVVVLVPGMGDDVQSLKAGIMEIADIFVINKADREGADRVEKEIRAMQSLAPAHGARDTWVPPSVKTIATTGEGADHLFTAIQDCREWLVQHGRAQSRRIEYWRARVAKMLQQELLLTAQERGLSSTELGQHADEIAAGREDPYKLVPALVARLFAERGGKQE